MADNYRIDLTLEEIFGTGIASVEQTETSDEPGGINELTITLTNGQTSTMEIRNGIATQEQVNTWLEQHPEATTTVQDGSITEAKFTDALKLKTINDYVTPEMFGAKGDGVTDDSTAINNALNSHKNVKFGEKTYLAKSTLILHENQMVVGSGWSTVIKSFDGSVPLLKTDSAEEANNILIRDLRISDPVDRTAYTILIDNGYGAMIDHVVISGGASDYHGISITKQGALGNNNYVAKIANCRLSKAKINLLASDSYVLNNEIWALGEDGEGQNCAIQVSGSNTIIGFNQLVGGTADGCILVKPETGLRIEGLKIIGNYFDGSSFGIDTSTGIKSSGIMLTCVISNNVFWNMKSYGIDLDVVQCCTINGNTFKDNGMLGNLVGDLRIRGNNSRSNVISSNSFYRNVYLTALDTTPVTRPTSGNPPIVDLTNEVVSTRKTTNAYKTILSSNSVNPETYFGAPALNNRDMYIITENATSIFNTVGNQDGNYTTYYTDYNDLPYGSFIQLAGGLTNAPTASGYYFVQTLQVANNANYALQIAYSSNGERLCTRKKEAGTWSSWIVTTLGA